MLSQMSQLGQRLIVGGLALILVICIIFFSTYPFIRPIFTLVIASVIGTSLWEFLQMAKKKGYNPNKTIAIVFGALLPFAAFLSTETQKLNWLPQALLFVGLFFAFAYYLKKGVEPLVNIALIVFGFLYIAIPLSCIILINYQFQSDGRWWLFILLAITKITDMSAYFVGKQFGKHLMAPVISPKKTWEGAIGGLAAGLLASLAIYYTTQHLMTIPPIKLNLFQSVFLGALLSLAGQVGDLAESLLKRDAQVKDSNQLPGLGGMLDMVDSLLFTAPCLYLFLRIGDVS